MMMQSMFQFVSTKVTENHSSQTSNWTIDLVVQRMGVYDLNHIFEVNIGARPHENMDMSADMRNMFYAIIELYPNLENLQTG